MTGAQGEHFGPALRGVEAKTQVARLIGDGIIAAFFCQDKPKKRIERLVSFQKDIQSHLGSSTWSEAIEPYRASLRQGDLPITPFHWEIEFPESTILDDPAQSLRAREAEWELGTFATDKYRSSLTTSRNHYAA